MRNLHFKSIIFIFLTMLHSNSQGKEKNTSVKGLLKKDYTLKWFENFDENQINLNRFNIEIQDAGWVNNELQAYTDNHKNIFIDNSILYIKAIKEKHGSAGYTSGRITTQGKSNWKYGRFEIRAKVPKENGSWPAIWLLSESINEDGWPKCGEIDIMEHINKENIVYGTVHSDQYNHMKENQLGGKIEIENLDKDFHTFGIEWTENSIIWFLDDNIYYQINKGDYLEGEWPYDQEYFLIMNLAVGGFWPGNPDEDFKTVGFEIDWIRVYE